MVAGSLRFAETQARTYRRVWKASVFSNFLTPVLFLAAMGVGLGSLVDATARASDLEGLSYISFLAPGLLAATAMMVAVSEASYPVMMGIKWIKTYHAALATPIGIRDLVIGHLIWVTVRLFMVTIVFALVATVFGAFDVGPGLVALPGAVLTGLGFAAATTAFAAWLENEMGLALLFRFAITPLFLFSGTFFPITQLPGFMQPIALVVPLWHGVQLTRGLALGLPFAINPAISVTYLIAWVVAGTALSVRFFAKRLQP